VRPASLHSMSPGLEGVCPSHLHLARDGLFYGATPDGGPSTGGTVCSMSATRTLAICLITRP